MGYSQITDSFVEGHQSDMIFINASISSERRTHIEAKSTEISLKDKDFSKELLGYLAEWLNLPPASRFSLFIFARKINNRRDMEKVIGTKYNITSLKDWLSKNAESLPDNSKEIVTKADFKDIINFISCLEVYEADINQLDAAINEKGRYSNLSIKAYAEKLQVDAKRRGKPINKKSVLISNMVPVTIPTHFYSAKVKFNKKLALYAHFNKKDVEIPPINFFPEKQTISTFEEIGEDSPLREVIVGKPEKIEITEDISEQFIIGLINQHLRRLFWKKDLFRLQDRNLYYFKCEMENGVYVSKTYPNSQGKDKEVCTPYYHEQNGTKTINFIYHHAVELSPKKLWDKYYITIIPVKIYTTDGINPVDSDAKSAIDQKFKNQLFNRSSNKLGDIRFWDYHIFRSKFLNKPAEKWFDLFDYGTLENIPFDWIPETVEKGQALLEEAQK